MGSQFFCNCSFLVKEPNQQIQTWWKPGQEQRFEGIGAIYRQQSPWGEILLNTEPMSPSKSGTRWPFPAPILPCAGLPFSSTACRSSEPALSLKPLSWWAPPELACVLSPSTGLSAQAHPEWEHSKCEAPVSPSTEKCDQSHDGCFPTNPDHDWH